MALSTGHRVQESQTQGRRGESSQLEPGGEQDLPQCCLPCK